MREHPPIAICDLADHIEKLKANDSLHFSQEYEVTLPFYVHYLIHDMSDEYTLLFFWAVMHLVHFFSNVWK